METLTGDRSPKATPPGITQRIDDKSSYRHRQAIGHFGFWLPWFLIVVVWITNGLPYWRNLESISAYYYSGAVPGFVGMLIAFAIFLFTYRGYRNKKQWADRLFGFIAGVAALGVAFFPTKEPNGVTPLTWWADWVGQVHYWLAGILFGSFAVFSLWLFREKDEQDKKAEKDDPNWKPNPDKKARNRVYSVCGVVILFSIGWALYLAKNERPIFWAEALALFAFSLSWLIKGYAHVTLENLVRRLLRKSPRKGA